jgi:hypothetical protein
MGALERAAGCGRQYSTAVGAEMRTVLGAPYSTADGQRASGRSRASSAS